MTAFGFFCPSEEAESGQKWSLAPQPKCGHVEGVNVTLEGLVVPRAANIRFTPFEVLYQVSHPDRGDIDCARDIAA
jgi:hypothetical protein